MEQHTHHSTPFAKIPHEIFLLCDQLQSPANIGAIFRLADAFGVTEVIFNTPVPIHSNRLKRTARTTETSVRYRIEENLVDTLVNLKSKGITPIALEITTKSVPIQRIKKIATQPIVLIIGNERHGVSESLLAASMHTHITMYGNNSSMNVAQATAIALYELTKP